MIIRPSQGLQSGPPQTPHQLYCSRALRKQKGHGKCRGFFRQSYQRKLLGCYRFNRSKPAAIAAVLKLDAA